jgi:uncharacterized lipoprotein YajG
MCGNSLTGVASAARFSVLVLLPLVLVGCATGPGTLLVTLPPYESPVATRGAVPTPRATVRLEPVRDARRDATGSLIGERTALNVSLGQIEMTPIPSEMIGQLLRAELRTLGYGIVSAEERFTIGAQIGKFEVLTPSTPIYWDMNGVIEIDVAVTGRDGKKQNVRYETSCTDRTYVYPSEELITQVVATCLGNLGAKVRGDPALARALGTQ